jgi:hypothetical protein
MAEWGNKTAHTLAILTIWCLWKQRNAITFRDSSASGISGAVRLELRNEDIRLFVIGADVQ